MISLYEFSVFIFTASSGNMICEQKSSKALQQILRTLLYLPNAGEIAPMIMTLNNAPKL